MRGIHVCPNEGPHPFPRGDDYEIVKIHWRKLKICCCRTTWPISTKLGTKHLSVKGIKVCSNEDPHPFARGNNYQIVKIHRRNLKILFQNHLANFKQIWHKASFGQVYSKEEPFYSKNVMGFLLLLINIMIQWYVIIDLNWFIRWVMWPKGLLLLFRCF